LLTDALTNAGCNKIFHEKTSGSRAERPEFSKAGEALREGNTLVVWKLDRLGRSVKNLVDRVGQLHNQGIEFKSLTDVSVAAKDGAILAGFWPCFRWQQPLPAFPRAAGRTIRVLDFSLAALARVRSSRRRANQASLVMFPLPSTSSRVALVVRHCGPFAHCHQHRRDRYRVPHRAASSFMSWPVWRRWSGN